MSIFALHVLISLYKITVFCFSQFRKKGMAWNGLYHSSPENVLIKRDEKLWNALGKQLGTTFAYMLIKNSSCQHIGTETSVYLRIIMLHNWDNVIITQRTPRMSALLVHSTGLPYSQRVHIFNGDPWKDKWYKLSEAEYQMTRAEFTNSKGHTT
jgi:hypothetical protein